VNFKLFGWRAHAIAVFIPISFIAMSCSSGSGGANNAQSATGAKGSSSTDSPLSGLFSSGNSSLTSSDIATINGALASKPEQALASADISNLKSNGVDLTSDEEALLKSLTNK